MKRTFLSALLAAAVASAAFAGQPISQDKLPKDVLSFLSTHFPGVKIYKAEQDQGYRGTEYEVDLENGAEVEFNSDGQWKEVKAAHSAAVPAKIIPEGIANYVTQKHAGTSIIKIERKRGAYEVKLSNGTELHLSADGTPAKARPRNGRPR